MVHEADNSGLQAHSGAPPTSKPSALLPRISATPKLLTFLNRSYSKESRTKSVDEDSKSTCSFLHKEKPLLVRLPCKELTIFKKKISTHFDAGLSFVGKPSPKKNGNVSIVIDYKKQLAQFGNFVKIKRTKPTCLAIGARTEDMGSDPTVCSSNSDNRPKGILKKSKKQLLNVSSNGGAGLVLKRKRSVSFSQKRMVIVFSEVRQNGL